MASFSISSSASSVYTCKCLNVKIHPRGGAVVGVGTVAVKIANPRDYPDLKGDQLSQKIFQGSTEVAEIELDVGGVRNEQPLLFSSSVVGNWSFFNCLNCKIATHCCRFSFPTTHGKGVDNVFPSHVSPPSPTSQNVMLVNITHMISDHKKIQQLSQSQDFSPLYRIILPTTWGSPNSSERWGSTSSADAFPSVPISPTSPSAYQPNSGRRLSAYPSPSSAESCNPIHQVVTTTLQQQLQKYLHEEETALELRIKKYEEEQREAFEAKAEKARRDRTYLLNLIRSNSLDDSTAVKSLRARRGNNCGSFNDSSDDVFHKPKSRRESAPTRPINIASGPNVNYPGIPTGLANLASPLGVGSPVYGGLIQVDKGSGSPAIFNPVTLTLPATNQNPNNNPSSPHGQRDSRRPTSPPDGLFSMDDEEDDDGEKPGRGFEEEEEEEELEDLGKDYAENCSPFEAVESSDVETDPDDNSQEDLRRDVGVGLSFIPAASTERERKYSKYSTSAPMNITVFPQLQQLNKGTVDIPLDEVEAAEEEELAERHEPAAAVPEPDPAQIAASMQAIAMSHRDEDDPEAIFGERPRRRLNTLELYQIRQFKKPTAVAKQSTANAPGLRDEGFSSSGMSGSGF